MAHALRRGATRFVNAVRNRLAPITMEALLGVRRRNDLQKIGSQYGGWIVPTSLLFKGAIVWSVGEGEDITFGTELIDRFGCLVWGIDPTPRAHIHAQRAAEGIVNYQFVPVGLWREDTIQRFYAPRDPSHVSHSIVNLQGTTDFFEAECLRPATLAKRLGHRSVDLIKLDIEGAEFDVISALLTDNIRPKVLCVEFDQPCSLLRVYRCVRGLFDAGYSLVAIDGWNYTFVCNIRPESSAATPS